MSLNLPDFTVSRETLDKLEIYKSLLIKWQKTINLVSPATLADSQKRHFDDSIQIAALVPRETKTLYDIGSGAGFPGLVMAATLENTQVHLVESDQRKCQFLKTVSREANIPVTIHNARVEHVDIPPPQFITARALASLNQLLEWTEKWWSQDESVQLLFLKGAKAEEEVLEAQKQFSFDIKTFQSKTDASGYILLLTKVSRIP